MPPRRVADLLQVGPILAGRILTALGGPNRSDRQALDAIITNPDNLLTITGIGPSKRDAIVRANGIDHVRRRHQRTPSNPNDPLADLRLTATQRALILEQHGRDPNTNEPFASRTHPVASFASSGPSSRSAPATRTSSTTSSPGFHDARGTLHASRARTRAYAGGCFVHHMGREAPAFRRGEG